MKQAATPLPVDDVLPQLLTALATEGMAVLQAPPGAGKTTKVPLAMLGAAEIRGRILMLEPRRIAARTAATRMAEILGEDLGQTVGFRIRGESRVSKRTRIEVVTEGILTRIIQSDPELHGVGAIIFDEFHERSLNADLGLALVTEIRSALREDLAIVVMSATLDAAPVAKLLGGAPVITSQGRAFPVETRWLEKPFPRQTRVETNTANLIIKALDEEAGSLLAFLPGEGEIRRCAAALKGRLGPDCHITPLFGAMKFADQQAAIRPAKTGRKIVLATAVAETSLTIEGIRIVVDAGLARRARFDPGSGMSRLVTEQVTKAEAEQRKGRAGRLSPGVCYRLWTRGEEGGMRAFAPAEIESADLSGLVCELALWGSPDPASCNFLTQPDPGAWASAVQLLKSLKILDVNGKITPAGKTAATLPMHPRLAHMLMTWGQAAAPLAALLSDRDPLGRGAATDIGLRLKALSTGAASGPYTIDGAAIKRIRSDTKRFEKRAPDVHLSDPPQPGDMLATAFPDRIAGRRPGDSARFLLSGGKGAILDDADPLAGQSYLVACDLDGNRREARIRLASAVSVNHLRQQFSSEILHENKCFWSRRDKRVLARSTEMLGAVPLSEQGWRDVPIEDRAAAATEGWRDLAPSLSKAAARFLARVQLVKTTDGAWPDFDVEHLIYTAQNWLTPWFLTSKKIPTTARELREFDITEALRALLPYELHRKLDQLVPAHFTSPLGNKIPIDYSQATPAIEIRLQEMFGTTRHPVTGAPPQPIRVTLLSPARRPIQVTSDIPGFWETSWHDVRKDMRGRYPKHPWPEDPKVADPTLRSQRRKSK